MTDEEERAFARGVIYAVARLIEMYDEPSMALDILRESGVDESVADIYDMLIVRRAKKQQQP